MVRTKSEILVYYLINLVFSIISSTIRLFVQTMTGLYHFHSLKDYIKNCHLQEETKDYCNRVVANGEELEADVTQFKKQLKIFSWMVNPPKLDLKTTM